MKLTISKKLNGFIILSLLTSIFTAVAVSTSYSKNNLVELLQKATLDTSSIMAGRVRSEMRRVAEQAHVLSAATLEDFKSDASKSDFLSKNLSIQKDIFAVALFRRTGATFAPVWRQINSEFQKSKNLQTSDFDNLDKTTGLALDSIAKGGVEFNVGKLAGQFAVLRVGLPFVKQETNDFSDILIIDLRNDLFTSVFSESTSELTFLVNGKGLVIGSSDPTRIAPGLSLKNLDIVKETFDRQEQSREMEYDDLNGDVQIGAFQKVGFAELSVISQVPLEEALKTQRDLIRRGLEVAAVILFLALALGFFFSQSMTTPIQKLDEAAGLIEKGDFSVRVLKLNQVLNKKGDEIHHLSFTFDQMAKGLQEREKVKAALSTYHSKELVDKVLSGELKIGGERKDATVLFTDIRSFTTMSESMDPGTLFQILNEYLSVMVNVILEHGGHIDKFIGDGILAVWGVPDAKAGDTDRAISCCIAMRQTLKDLNETFAQNGTPEFKIGMGLNFGPVIAGNIGSKERMEYTIIGDTVNTATRIETLTKMVGTDLLVSDSVLKNSSGKYITEGLEGQQVKGKTQTVQVFKIDGHAVEEEAESQNIETELEKPA